MLIQKETTNHNKDQTKKYGSAPKSKYVIFWRFLDLKNYIATVIGPIDDDEMESFRDDVEKLFREKLATWQKGERFEVGSCRDSVEKGFGIRTTRKKKDRMI